MPYANLTAFLFINRRSKSEALWTGRMSQVKMDMMDHGFPPVQSKFESAL
jgi:hypothetical protein